MKGNKVAVFCSAGGKRSPLLAFHLKTRGYDAIPCGMDMNSKETIEMLCEWADQIVLTEHVPEWWMKVPAHLRYKIRGDISVGPDVWAERWHPDLEALCVREAQKFARF